MPSFEYRRIKSFDNTELFLSENENDYFPFHFHDFYCVSLITRGTEILSNKEQEFIAPSGTISITQLNEVHRNYSLTENGYSYKTIYVNPDVLRHFNNNTEVPALERVIDDEYLFKRLLYLFDNKNATESDWQESFRRLSRHATNPLDENYWSSTFHLIDELIDSHPNKPIDANWLARQFCMSKFHFIREFKKARGITPQTYIMLCRLMKSKKMLVENFPLADIAFLQGFYDQSHFTNSFKRYFGVNPSQYLKS